jgi:CheY-like chemotaxis protein
MINLKNTEKKILIVEDTRVIAECLSDLLDSYGEIDIAYNGQEALAKVAFASFNAVISDVNMPVMDGIEFYRAAVKNDPGIKDRFMFFTSSFETKHLNFFIDNDVPFLFKPAQAGEIISMVTRILGRQCEEPAPQTPHVKFESRRSYI